MKQNDGFQQVYEQAFLEEGYGPVAWSEGIMREGEVMLAHVLRLLSCASSRMTME